MAHVCTAVLMYCPSALCTACRYYDGEMRPLLARHTRKRSNTGIDLRAGALPLVLPPAGDPTRTDLRVAYLTWTLKMDHEWLVRVGPLRNKQPAFGFLLQEADRQAFAGLGWAAVGLG